ncbi:eukaryotic aspartyl protease family protein [Striga asiatica]|uniref:Eukaryotic aspartyl protease family protein n=1 Tax=Striga asiatica TaxID=4170 RepID=A0A5A7PYS7_STRAF|nr:eukaryotic aspartyl protease family protein [Striga asiatica]
MFEGEATDITGLDIVFDSGSTYTYLNNVAFGAIFDLIERYNNIKGPSSQKGPLIKQVNDPSFQFCWKGSQPFIWVFDVGYYFNPLALNFTSTNVLFPMGIESYLIISVSISFQDKLVLYDNDRQLVGWE